MNTNQHCVLEHVNFLLSQLISGKIQCITCEMLKEKFPDEELRNSIIDELDNNGIFVAPEVNSQKLTPFEEAELCRIYKLGTDAEKLLKENPSLLEEQKKQLNKMVMEKQRAFALLENKYHHFIKKVAKKFNPKKSDEQDFYQSAMLGFTKALNEVDFETHENSLATFAWTKMLAEVQNEKERYCASIPISHLIIRQKQAYLKYKEEHGDKVEDLRDLAKALDIRIKSEKDLINLSNKILIFENISAPAISLSTKINNNDHKDGELSDLIPSNDLGRMESKIKEENLKQRQKILFSYLSLEEQLIWGLRVYKDMKYDELEEYINGNRLYLTFDKQDEYTREELIKIYKRAKQKLMNHSEEIQRKIIKYRD